MPQKCKIPMTLLKAKGSYYFFYAFEATSETLAQFLASKLKNIAHIVQRGLWKQMICGRIFGETELEQTMP